MSRTVRFLLVLVLIGGISAWRHFHDRPAVPARPSTGANRTMATPAPTRRLGTLAFTPCTLAPQSGAASVEAQCTTLPVAENPARPRGRKVRLHIAWVPADEEGPTEPDPVFRLAGGPGQAATASY